MSDYTIYRVPAYQTHNVDMKFESVSDGEFTLIEEQSPSPSFPVNGNDIVKVKVLHNGVSKYIYALYKSQDYDGLDFRLTCSFDSDVYGGIAEAETDVITLEYVDEADLVSAIDVKGYNLSPNFTVATYGKSYNAYNFVESYNISIPQERIKYSNGFKSMYNNYDDKILVDVCDRKVYKVSPTDLSVTAVNGSIKTSLNFNVIIK